MSYLPVHIQNSTDYSCVGTVTYRASNLCTSDDYTLDPLGSWTAESRGGCLIRIITAQLTIDGQKVDAVPYEDGGSRSQFAVIHSGENQYSVTRVVT